jgi:hypothetical protein
MLQTKRFANIGFNQQSFTTQKFTNLIQLPSTFLFLFLWTTLNIYSILVGLTTTMTLGVNVTSKINFLLPFKDVEDKSIVRFLGGIPLFDDTLPFYTCVYAKELKFG